jgi:hypothetical protein
MKSIGRAVIALGIIAASVILSIHTNDFNYLFLLNTLIFVIN